jgi:hypothetical protein
VDRFVCIASGLLLSVVFLASRVPLADAVILPPVTIDGPSSEVLSLGGVAMAADGTGGLVYTKDVDGVSHIFASRFDGSQWSTPIRVDPELPYEATEPRIAAGPNGRLMVVWVTEVGTGPTGKIRRGLYSAALGPRSGEFGSALLVDPNVGEGVGVDPSLAGTTPGKAIVAYRVVTFSFPPNSKEFSNFVQQRPGDVIAEVRVARLESDRWSRLGAINRSPDISTRAPDEENGPKVAIGDTGHAVVAWQESDVTGVARILFRRVTGTTLGPIFAASPESWEGSPVSDDATAIGLAVTGFDEARVAVRVDGAANSALAGERIFLTTVGSRFKPEGAKPVGPELADGGGPAPPGPLGPPAIAAADAGGAQGTMRLLFATGGAVRQLGVEVSGKLQPAVTLSGPSALPGSPAVASVDPEGGGVSAYEATDPEGLPTVAVDQESPGGGSQTGMLYGPIGGPISELTGAGSEAGDELLGFRQGEGGEFAIVGTAISAAPAEFSVTVPKKWVPPGKAIIRWQPAPSALGQVTYGVIINGRAINSGLRGLEDTPPRPALFDGVQKVTVMATDRFGQNVISRPAKLRVDGQSPRLQVSFTHHREAVRLKLRDSQSGLLRRATRVNFGDGTHKRGGGGFFHLYSHPGRYTIHLQASDRVHNRLVQRIPVVVR